MADLTAIDLIPDLSSNLGDLIAKAHPCFKRYRHDQSLFDKYESDQFGESIYDVANDFLQLQKESEFDVVIDNLFDENCEYMNNLWNGCILESDCKPVLSATLKFEEHKVCLDACVTFSYIGREESSDEHYVIIDGQHIDFSKFVKQQVISLLKDNQDCNDECFSETPEYFAMYDKVYDTLLNAMPRAKASDCAKLTFNDVELLSLYEFYRNNPYY